MGRPLLDFYSQGAPSREKLYATVLAAAALGLLVFAIVTAAERALTRGQEAAPVS